MGSRISRNAKCALYVLLPSIAFLAFAIFAILKRSDQLVEKCPNCNVIVISLSSFNPKHSMVYGYPQKTDPLTKKWLKDAIVFKNHYAVSSWPYQSNMSLFSGLLPKNHKVYSSSFHSKDQTEDVLSKEIKTLPEKFKENDYQTLFYGGAPHQAILSLSAGFERGFDLRYPNGLHRHEDIPTLLNQLELIQDKKFFAFISSVRLHFPYFLTPEFPGKSFKNPNYKGHFPTDEADYEKKYQDYRTQLLTSMTPEAQFKARPAQFLSSVIRYNNQQEKNEDRDFLHSTYNQALQYNDYFIDQIFLYLKNKNLLSNTIVIITSDVSPNLMESYRTSDQSITIENLFSDLYLDGTSRIPLMIYHPKRESKKMLMVDAITNTTDVYNLISSIVDIPTEKNDGREINLRHVSLGDSFNYYKGHEYYARDKNHILIKNQTGLKAIDVQSKTFNDFQNENLPETYKTLLKALNEYHN